MPTTNGLRLQIELGQGPPLIDLTRTRNDPPSLICLAFQTQRRRIQLQAIFYPGNNIWQLFSPASVSQMDIAGTRMFVGAVRYRIGAALMFRVPLWAGPSHVMKLRPIGFASEPHRHDHIQALAKRRRCAFTAQVMLRFAVTKFSCHCLATELQMNGPGL